MMTPSQLGQKVRAVQKHNKANARAFRHFVNCDPWTFNPQNPSGTICTKILNVRAFKRHFRQACKIEYRHGLTVFDVASLPSETETHSEPTY